MTWGEKQYSHPTPEEFVAKLAYMYSLNASVSIYMFHGGTNFGFLNGAEVILLFITYINKKNLGYYVIRI